MNNFKKYLYFLLLIQHINLNVSPLNVSQGGTGNSQFSVLNAVLCAGILSTNPWQPVSSLGSTGNLLVSNGSSSLPSFQSKKAGLVHISTKTSSSTLSFTFFNTEITSTYNNYLLVYKISANAAANNFITLQLSTDNGSTFINTNYSTSYQYHPYNSTTITNFSSTTLARANTSSAGTVNQSKSGYIFLCGLQQTLSTGPFYFGRGINADGGSGVFETGFAYGVNTGSNLVNCVRLLIGGSATNLNAIASLYGIPT